MRRTLIGLTSLLVAGGLTALTGTPAHALGSGQCPDNGDTVTVIGTGGPGTIYLDNRGLDGGHWIYLESGAAAGLQRGGDHPGFWVVNPNLPFISPIPVLPPNPGGAPVLPNGLTLFPEGFGGGSTSEAVALRDRCYEQNADYILF